ncbi:MAG: long-chain-fatty-acid--CoA ligase [Dehalococcoidales bacterium]|nr:long-chain-fatty-acid--CoA ligase [Dehalococcoidales bacterium]
MANNILVELSRYPIGTFADVIYRHSLLIGDNVALIYQKERCTFAEYNARVNSLVRAIQALGVRKGETIGILSWNSLDFAYLLGAAMKGGFISSPFNPRLSVSDLDYIINYSETSVVFVAAEFADTIKQLRPQLPKVKHVVTLEKTVAGMPYIQDLIKANSSEELDVQLTENDPMAIIYTSGTTGRPKGALYTQGRMVQNALVNMTAVPFAPNDINILALQLFHIASNEFFQVTLFAGATTVLLKTLDAQLVMQTVQDEKATIIALVPTVLAGIFNLPDLEKYDHSSLQRIAYLGSPMPVALLKQGIEKFGLVFCQQYGQTESGPLISTLKQPEHKVAYGTPEEQKLLASCGRPIAHVHARIVDGNGKDCAPGEVGEIIVQSKQIMQEYWHKPKETSETIIDGWLHTRDLAYFDEKGYMYIADRKQDMIITGGEHVFPREVEEVLYQHPMVLEAAVIGVPDPYWVERVHAFVTLKKGSECTPEEIIEYCKGRMSRYKAPKSVEFVDVLPKNATGKIMKTELRKMVKEREEKKS